MMVMAEDWKWLRGWMKWKGMVTEEGKDMVDSDGRYEGDEKDR